MGTDELETRRSQKVRIAKVEEFQRKVHVTDIGISFGIIETLKYNAKIAQAFWTSSWVQDFMHKLLVRDIGTWSTGDTLATLSLVTKGRGRLGKKVLDKLAASWKFAYKDGDPGSDMVLR